MKRCSKCGEEKSLEEFPKSKGNSDGRLGSCKTCFNSVRRLYATQWRTNNPNKTSEYSKKNRIKNLESRRKWDRDYAKNNRKKKTEAYKNWRHKNPTKAKEANSRNYLYQREWAKNHPEVYAHHAGIRRAQQKLGTPAWVKLDREHLKRIKLIYKSAKIAEDFHEIPYHVDHIEPLVGINENRVHVSCGLHVYWNLRAIPAFENQEKSNKLFTNI